MAAHKDPAAQDSLILFIFYVHFMFFVPVFA